MTYDALILTNLPNYYKINLYNRLAEYKKILVVFIDSKHDQRNDDFMKLDECRFDHYVLTKNSAYLSKVISVLRLLQILLFNSYNKIILGEWFRIQYWIGWLFFSRKKTLLTLESHQHLNKNVFIKSLKKIFLSKVGNVLASGPKHAHFLEKLDYNGEISITNGVGIINYNPIQNEVKNGSSFLYVGRLSNEKNLTTLLTIFSKVPYRLTIVGEGPMEAELRKMATENVQFTGYINNSDLGPVFQSHRALILISSQEPYGLVAEESIYFSIPVIISSNCGIFQTEIISEKNSIVCSQGNEEEVIHALHQMFNEAEYEQLKNSSGSHVILEKDLQQVKTYIKAIG